MKLKRIGLMGIVFTCTIWLTFYSGTLSFAQCPDDYPYDCENGWCCEYLLACLSPSELEGLFCTRKSEIECPSLALYGEYSEEVELLRDYRDEVLSQTPVGQEIIKLYYQLSPVIVKAMGEDEEFKEDIKELIDGVLGLITEEAK